MVPQKDTVTEREANNINGLCAQLSPNDDHLQVPGAPFEHNLQCLGSDALIYLPRHRPSKCQCLVCARKLRLQFTKVPLPPRQCGTRGLLSSALCSPPDHACGPHSYFLLPSLKWASVDKYLQPLAQSKDGRNSQTGGFKFGVLVEEFLFLSLTYRRSTQR